MGKKPESLRRRVAQLIGFGATPTEALRAVDEQVSESTIYNWLREPDFQEMIKQECLAVLRSQSAKLLQNMTKLAYEAESENVRATATKDLLARGDIAFDNLPPADQVIKVEITTEKEENENTD